MTDFPHHYPAWPPLIDANIKKRSQRFGINVLLIGLSLVGLLWVRGVGTIWHRQNLTDAKTFVQERIDRHHAEGKWPATQEAFLRGERPPHLLRFKQFYFIDADGQRSIIIGNTFDGAWVWSSANDSWTFRS